jgi:hypothetical protein
MDVGSLSNLRVLSAVIVAGTMILASACSSDVANPVAPGAGTGVVNAEHESSSTTAGPAASSALEGDDLCHRTSGTTAFVLITAPASAVDTHRSRRRTTRESGPRAAGHDPEPELHSRIDESCHHRV